MKKIVFFSILLGFLITGCHSWPKRSAPLIPPPYEGNTASAFLAGELSLL